MCEFNIIEGLAPTDEMQGIIKVIGVGGGGCNAVANMYREGIDGVTFAAVNTDSQVLSKSPVPQKLVMGGLGAGGNPDKGREEAEKARDSIKSLLMDGTKLVFITAGMGGGTGTGAAPIVAGIAKDMGILTVGIVTIPFFFEKQDKIIKALRGVNEMRKNVDALLIINNERLCDVYADTAIPVKEAFRRADRILSDAARSIAEIITVEGDINLDFRDVETTLRGGGGAIMAMGKGRGELRVEKAIIDALDSPLLYGNDISKAGRLLFNVYTSEAHPLLIPEMNEVDAFMAELNPDISVIWGVCDDNSLADEAKVTILASDFSIGGNELGKINQSDDEFFESLIPELYRPYQHGRQWFSTGKLRQVQKINGVDDSGLVQQDVNMKVNINGQEVVLDDIPSNKMESSIGSEAEKQYLANVGAEVENGGINEEKPSSTDVKSAMENTERLTSDAVNSSVLGMKEQTSGAVTFSVSGEGHADIPAKAVGESCENLLHSTAENVDKEIRSDSSATVSQAEKPMKPSPMMTHRMTFIERAKAILKQKMNELTIDNEDL